MASIRDMAAQGALVLKRSRANTITGYAIPLLSSSAAHSAKPSAPSSPFWGNQRLASPMDAPVPSFDISEMWDSPYKSDPLQSPAPVAYQSLSPATLFSPKVLEPSLPGAFDANHKSPAPSHEQQRSLSSSNSDNNSLWSHVGTPTGNGTAGSSPPSEKGTLGSPQKMSSALAQSTSASASASSSTLGQSSSTLGRAPQLSSTLKSTSVTPSEYSFLMISSAY